LSVSRLSGYAYPSVSTLRLGDDNTYLDVHRGALIHVAFIGVDYSQGPRKICEEILQQAAKMGIEGKMAGGTSWLNRKNRTMFGG